MSCSRRSTRRWPLASSQTIPGAPGRLRFAHVLIRDTLYEGLTTARRVRLHRLAVEALEALYGDEPGPHLAELAHHAIAGRDFDKGVRYARRAGDRALALLAYEEAARLYRDGARGARPADQTRAARCELLLSLGEAEVRAGNTPAAKKAFLDAAGIARRLGLRRELARAAAGYGGRTCTSEPGAMIGSCRCSRRDSRRSRRRTSSSGPDCSRASRGRSATSPRATRRDALSREAVELARRSGNSSALAYALDGRAAAIVAPDTIAECLALATELSEVAERIGDTERIVHGHLHRLIAQSTVGDISEMVAGVDAMSRIADELGQPAHLWEARAGQAMLALAAGRLAEGEELIAGAFALGERAKPEIAIPVYRLQQYTLCDFRGGLEALEPAIRDLVTDWPARPAFRCALAHLHARIGWRSEAQRALDDLTRDDCSALPFDQEWLYGMSLLAETSALLRDTDSAAILYELLVPWAAFNAADWPEGIRGSLARYLGMLATTTTALGPGTTALRGCARDERSDGRSPLARAHPARLRADAPHARPDPRSRASSRSAHPGAYHLSRARHRDPHDERFRTGTHGPLVGRHEDVTADRGSRGFRFQRGCVRVRERAAHARSGRSSERANCAAAARAWDEDHASSDARSALTPLLRSHASEQRTSLLRHGRMCRQQMSEHPRLRNA